MADKKKGSKKIESKQKSSPAQARPQEAAKKRDLWFHPGANRDFNDPKTVPD